MNRSEDFSGRERGEQNCARFREYLLGLKASGASLPNRDGDLDITAISKASGIARNAFYTNSRIKAMLREANGQNPEFSAPQLAQASSAAKDRRILRLEQELAAARAEIEELRNRLVQLQVVEEVITQGRRVIP
jgi:hypothetical protein